MIIKLVGAVNNLLWGDLIILEFSGEISSSDFHFWYRSLFSRIYFTFKTRFLPFRLFPEMIQVTLEKMKQKKDEKLYIWCSGTYRCYCYPRRYGKLSRCCCCYLIWRRWSCFLDVADRTHWLFQQFYRIHAGTIYKRKRILSTAVIAAVRLT